MEDGGLIYKCLAIEIRSEKQWIHREGAGYPPKIAKIKKYHLY